MTPRPRIPQRALPYSVDHTDLARRAARPLSEIPRPFLTWAGSKRLLLGRLVDSLPRSFGRYYEPFLGAGSLFFLLRPRRARLGDTCAPLIGTYQALAEDARAVWQHLSVLRPTQAEYYRVRDVRSRGRFKAAAQFIFLNKTCWNGLYRVNSSGRFNVPFGRPRREAEIASRENLVACGDVLRSPDVELLSADFEVCLSGARRGDLVYLDPPYVTGHNNNGFIDYNEVLFSWYDQVRLARIATDLKRRGVTVVVSNADHPAVRRLYRGFCIESFDRKATISGKMSTRGHSREIVARSN